MKIYKITDSKDLFAFECPACGCLHSIKTPDWSFNHDFENPTVTPSIRVRSSDKGKETTCHFFVTNGQIHYCDDSTHKLAGKTVEMIEI